MDYRIIVSAFSAPRLEKYFASSGDLHGCFEMYKANLLLSQQMFSVLSIFEVVLRNAINEHYKQKFGENWLLTQIQLGGFLWKKGCETSRNNLWATIGKLGEQASNDKAVAELNFSFWRYMFNSKEFMAGGSSLLQIFPNRPKAKNHTDFFKDLSEINFIRNRIAHHEPICFDGLGSSFSHFYAEGIYDLISDFFGWLGFPSQEFFRKMDLAPRNLFP